MTQDEKIVNKSFKPKDYPDFIISRGSGYARISALNTITQKYNDPKQETLSRQEDKTISLVRGNIARDRQLKHSQSFDPITNLPRVEDAPPPRKKNPIESFGSGVPYNIIKNTELPPILLTERAKKHRPPRPAFNHAPSLARRRAIDIINNRHVNDHDEKLQEEVREKEKQQAVRRYWQSRNFDPIRQRYYDENKEEAYHLSEEISKQVQGQAQAQRLPPSIRCSLGRGYDIVGHKVKDPESLAFIDTMDSRHLRRYHRPYTEEAITSRGVDQATYAETRRLNRISNRKVRESHDPQGFNIITGKGRLFNEHRNDLTQGTKSHTAWDRIAPYL